MSKKILAVLLVVGFALTIIVSSAVFAQETDPTLESLYQQVYELRTQIVERRVELGQLSESEGTRMLERMEERFRDGTDEGFGRSGGMRGRDWDDDSGRGFGHCWQW